MANTYMYDGIAYESEADAPDLGSLVCVDSYPAPYGGGEVRKYRGLEEDKSKLPTYDILCTGSSCIMTDSGNWYYYNKTTKSWTDPDNPESA